MWEWIAIGVLFVAIIGLRLAIERLASEVLELREEIKTHGEESAESEG